jgi:tol-pal system protein YbgF
MKKILILTIFFFISSCSGYTKIEKHNQDIDSLQESIRDLKKKEYEIKLKIDLMNSQLIIMENQLIKFKKKLNNKTIVSNNDNFDKKEQEIKGKLTQDEILKITELSKKEEEHEEPIVLTNSMLGTSYKEHSKEKSTKTKTTKYSKKDKKSFLKTMEVEYAEALELYRNNKFNDSILKFNHLIKKYSHINSSLTDNFYYWLGENYLSLKDIPLARKNFELVINKYPKANKVPDSMFKLGFILEQEERSKLAISNYYKPLIKKYLNTEAGKLAKERLQKLKP